MSNFNFYKTNIFLNLCTQILQITSVIVFLQCFKNQFSKISNTILRLRLIFFSFELKAIFNDLSKLKDFFDLSNLEGSYGLFSNVEKRVNGLFKTEPFESFWIDNLCMLRTKWEITFFCMLKEKENKTKLKGIKKAASKKLILHISNIV